jgi:hypothetical protein
MSINNEIYLNTLLVFGKLPLMIRVRAETQRPLPKPEPELSSVPELPEPAGTAGTQGAKHGQMHRIWHRFRPRYTSSA